jgi:hypothetical protein
MTKISQNITTPGELLSQLEQWTTNHYPLLIPSNHQLDTLHNHIHFIKTHSIDMFQAPLAPPQEALHKHSFGGCSVLL